MARSGFAVLALVVLLTVLKTGSCIQCFQCTSQSDVNCGDPFKSKATVNCESQDSINYNLANLRGILAEPSDAVPGAPRYCHKIVMQTGTVIRACLDGSPTNIQMNCNNLLEKAKNPSVSMAQKVKSCSVCDKDNCNGASAAAVSIPLASLALIISYLFCKQ